MEVVDKIGNVATGARGPLKEDAPAASRGIERIERVAATDSSGRAVHLGFAHRCEPPAIIDQFLEFSRVRPRTRTPCIFSATCSKLDRTMPQTRRSRCNRGTSSLASHGVPCFVMHGNRDSCWRRNLRMSGARLLPDPLIVTLYGERCCDARRCTCSDDRALQRCVPRAGTRLAAPISRTLHCIAPRVAGPHASAARRTPPP